MSGNGKSQFEFRIEIIVEHDDGIYHAYCPAFKGLHTCGDTEGEAIQNAKIAAIAYLRSLIKHGDPIPIGIIARTDKTGRVRGKPYPRHRVESLVFDPAC